jgi:large subunit ribosomal protein L6
MVSFTVADNVVEVKRSGDSRQERALHGLHRSLLSNCVEGVSKGFSKTLEAVGVGYKVSVQGKNVVLNVGFSHPVNFELPAGIEATAESNTKLIISGVDKQLVGEVAAQIRRVRPPEPYKGKGIKYIDEQIRRKAGKSGK